MSDPSYAPSPSAGYPVRDQAGYPPSSPPGHQPGYQGGYPPGYEQGDQRGYQSGPPRRYQPDYSPEPPRGRSAAPAPNVLRTTAVFVLVAAAVLVTAVAPVARWARATLLDTDRYTSTMTPLADDPGVQQLVITAVDNRIVAYLGSGSIAPGLSGAVVNAVVTRVVTGPSFPQIWAQVNRAAHPQIVAILTGRPAPGSVVGTNGDQVTLDVGPVIAYAKQQFAALGLAISGLPTTGANVTVAEVPRLTALQSLVRFVDVIAPWLPWLALVLFAAAMALAKRRLRVLQVGGVLVALAMVVDELLLAASRSLYVHRVDKYIDAPTARRVFDSIVHSLRVDLLVVLGVALLLAVLAVVAEVLLRRRARRSLNPAVAAR